LQFLIIGDGPLKSELEAMAADLGISDEVEFTGYSKNLAGFLPSLDLHVITSQSEGIPYALLEAMSAGVPTVSPAVGGLAEILKHEENALLTDSRHETDLAREVGRALSDGSLRRRLSESARQTVKTHFSCDVMLDATLDVYERGLAGKTA